MSDPRPDHDSTLSPAEDDAVRALLASARHTDPMPPDVVARLEAALTTLGAEDHEARRETIAPVVALASRRRRTAATVLLAAAAVVVFGVGIGQVLPTGSSDDSAGSSAESATSAEDESLNEDRAFGADPSENTDDQQGNTSERSATEAAPLPSSRAFGDLSALTSGPALKPQVRALRRGTPAASFSADPADPACPLPVVGEKEVLSVTYNGLPGALVLSPPVGGTQQVEVFLCDRPVAVRSLQLRAP